MILQCSWLLITPVRHHTCTTSYDRFAVIIILLAENRDNAVLSQESDACIDALCEWCRKNPLPEDLLEAHHLPTSWDWYVSRSFNSVIVLKKRPTMYPFGLTSCLC